ncbi:MAG: lytic transglycosylase domain-containing protein [Marmoricola sp.]
MSEKYAPKHRNVPARPAREGLRNAAVLSGVAVAATGLAVSGGVLKDTGSPLTSAASALGAVAPTNAASSLTQAELADREQRASRSSDDRRPVTDSAKASALSNKSGVAVTKSEDLTVSDPKTLARALMPQYGLSSSEFGCVDNIWTQESGWNVHADNPSSSAYGIPQALPGSKMSSAGPDWADSAETQIRWGLGYIKSRYGSACSAWSFKQGHGWY